MNMIMSLAGLTILRTLPSTCEIHMWIDRTICQPGPGLPPANTRYEHHFRPKALILWSPTERMDEKVKADVKDTVTHSSRTRPLTLLNFKVQIAFKYFTTQIKHWWKTVLMLAELDLSLQDCIYPGSLKTNAKGKIHAVTRKYLYLHSLEHTLA